jgi:PAS domain S-box-containing protein
VPSRLKSPSSATPSWSHVAAGEHLVQYYEGDDCLLDSLRGYIGVGLQRGEAAVVIASGEHLLGLEARLSSDGIDVPGARASGQYVALNAAETLAGFMVDGTPDPAAFARVIGPVLSEAGRAGGATRPVRAFGEMVAILWESGNHGGAIHLEQLWNDLGSVHSFALLCAYPLRCFGRHDRAPGFDQVCAHHTRVIAAEPFQALDGDPDRAREIARLQQRAAALETELASRRAAERDLAEFLENAVEGVHRVGPDGRIQWANRAELRMLGYDAEEYIGRHIASFHADREVIDDILARLLRGETVHNREVRLIARDGSLRDALINSNARWEQGEFRYTRCFTRDITSEKGVRDARARLAAIVDSSDDAIVSKDLSGVITSWNPGAERLFGYTAREAVGQPITMLIPADRLGEENTILGHIRRGEPIEHYETVRRRKDGSLVDVSVTVSPVRDSAGRIVGASKIGRNITERKRASEEREALLARERAVRHELEQANAELKDFAHIVGHDLREPLRGISTHIQFLETDEGEALTESVRTRLGTVQRLTRRAYDLLDAVMILSGVGRSKLQIAEAQASALIALAIENMRARLEEHRAQVTQEPAEVKLCCDSKLAVWALTNLIGNALKYNESDPKTIRIGCTAPPGVRPVFFVQDNGIGIDPRHHQRIFQMFKRLHQPERYGGGTGAGLAIVRRIVERHRGRVWVESRPGLGATFFFTLAPDPDVGPSTEL